jgi:hypothetical protein
LLLVDDGKRVITPGTLTHHRLAVGEIGVSSQQMKSDA